MILRIRQMLVKEFLQMFRDAHAHGGSGHAPGADDGAGLCPDHGRQKYQHGRRRSGQQPESRSLVAEFTGGGYFRVTHWFTTDNRVQRLLDAGTVRAVIRIPPIFRLTCRRARRSPCNCSWTVP
jgi:ABC-2 type transport system permease protein